jgi:glycosyltransferase involved in cell wall biosynthesis
MTLPSHPYPSSNAARSPQISFFVACYNEAPHILGTLDAIGQAVTQLAVSYEIIVIDDASLDHSVRLIEEYLQANPHVPLRLVVNPRNLGLAHNFFAAAHLGDGEYFKLVCGDNVESVEAMVAVLSHMGEADIVLPFHDVCVGKSAVRTFLSKIFTRIVNFLNGHSIRYYNGLPVFHRVDVLRCPVPAAGFGFQAELVSQLLDCGLSYREVRIDVRERSSGKSSALTWRNFVAVAGSLTRIGVRRLGRLLGLYRKRSWAHGSPRM